MESTRVREERCKHKITPRHVIEELGEKPLCDPPSQIDPLANKLEYTNNKRPFKPSLPNVLEPSNLLLSMDFSESCLH